MPRDLLLAKPKSWDTFEDIACDLFTEFYKGHNFQRYGRQGQGQNGVDIVGVVQDEVVGIQCKHSAVDDKLTSKQLDDEIKKADEFSPTLNKLIFATSASRDTILTTHCLNTSIKRKSSGKFEVEILFWEDILNKMEGFPHLIYKHFTKYFSRSGLEKVDDDVRSSTHIQTSIWPISNQELETLAFQSLKGAKKVDPYSFRLALTSFGDRSFEGNVNLIADLDQSNGLGTPCDSFQVNAEILKQIRAILKTDFYSPKISIYLNTRLSSAMLAGWMFKRVSGFDINFIVNNHVFPTSGLPYVRNDLIFHPSIHVDPSSNEIVLIASLSRDISSDVLNSLSSLGIKPGWILHYQLPSQYLNAAQVLSLAETISMRIKELTSHWKARVIHLFFAGPSAVAAQIGYNLNAVSPIFLYYKDHDDDKFVLSGVIKNGL